LKNVAVEWLLELTFPTASGEARVDVRADVDDGDTVGALTEALLAFADRHGHRRRSAHVALALADTGQILDGRARVADTGLVNGLTVALVAAAHPLAAPPPGAPPAGVAGVAPAAGRRPEHGGAAAVGEGASPMSPRPGVGLTLDVAAGPEAGRVVPLATGDVIVGRDGGCDIAVNDPALSRQHFALHVATDGTVWIAGNPSATNGTAVGGRALLDAGPLELGELIDAGSSVFAVRRATPDETRRADRLGQIPFNRVPYRRTVVRPRVLDEVPAPPATPGSGRFSIAAALAPLPTSLMMVALTGRYLFLAMSLASPVMLLYRHLVNRRGGRRRFVRDRAAFLALVDERAADVDRALDEERRTRLTAAPDLAELARQAMLHMPRLWERNRTAGDLLDLRLGLGEAESQVTAAVGRGGDDDLRAQAAERLAHQGTVTGVPITVDLPEVGVMGAWGDPDQVASMARALVAQAACLHSPEDLVVAAAIGDALAPGFEWLKWLPHVRSATSPLEGDHLAVGPEGGADLVRRVLAVAADRSHRHDGRTAHWPRLLLAVDERAEPDRAVLSQLLDVAPLLGINVLWLGESHLQVPRQCRAVVDCPGTAWAGRLRFTDPALPNRLVELDGADPGTARSIARALAPLRDASAASQTTAVPRQVPLLDALGIDVPSADAIARRWQAPRPYGLEFPIGQSADGTFHLDLVEHGPHMLVGGTSGAGKSELLQTLVLALAANHPPTRLNFLFVDYKGGAGSAAFRDLPHTVGYVTNLDGLLSLRALTSLRAELQRRMSLLEGTARDLAEMLAVAPRDAPPSLVIVVDEFATLVTEVPDFVAGIIDIAQRGRSLGVHLILATQRPTGVVNDDILANTNLRVSLRVLDPADSNNIIGSRDAADIPVPLRGRAYARTGPQTLVPFQCAWSGAPFARDAGPQAVAVAPFTAGAGGPGGASRPAAAPPGVGTGGPPGPPDSSPTQLEVMVRACRAADGMLGLPPVRPPWVEPLAEVIELDGVLDRWAAETRYHRPDPGRCAVLGLCDDPENQVQRVAAVDLEASGGLLVFGTGGSGKTTLLRTVAVGLARQGAPDEVGIYVLDFASRALDPLADLPHCGAVVAADDVERTTRLLSFIEAEIDRRRAVLAAARAETLGALRSQHGAPPLRRLVVLLDGYSGFHATFDRADRYGWLQLLERIVSQGRQVGVHCVLTTDRRVGVPTPLLSAISARVALRMATPEDLSALGVPAKLARDAELPGGRGFHDGRTELQVACVSADPGGVAQARAVAAVAAQVAARHPGRAPALPELPDSFVLDGPAAAPLIAPLGVVDMTLARAEVDLRRQSLVVIGPPLSGKSTALETVARGLRASTPPSVRLVALGSAASPLSGLGLWDDAAFSRAQHAALVARLAERLRDEEGVDARAILFVDAAEDVEGNDVLRPLESIARSDAVRLAVACEAGTIGKAYSGWLSALRRNRSAVLLQPESRSDIEAAVGVKPTLRPEQEFPPGRGILVAQRRWSLVQVGLRPGAA
jgi:S-DNA-T family DNA segregation ATPase FtsK/SpoIIIE